MKIACLSLLFAISFTIGSAQVEKTIHQTFEVGASNTILLDLTGEYSIVPWAGNTVMTETKVELYDASPSILKHLVEKDQRYKIEADTSQGLVRLISFDKKREPVRTRSGACTELVHTKVFVPENFRDEGGTKFIKTE